MGASGEGYGESRQPGGTRSTQGPDAELVAPRIGDHERLNVAPGNIDPTAPRASSRANSCAGSSPAVIATSTCKRFFDCLFAAPSPAQTPAKGVVLRRAVVLVPASHRQTPRMRPEVRQRTRIQRIDHHGRHLATGQVLLMGLQHAELVPSGSASITHGTSPSPISTDTAPSSRAAPPVRPDGAGEREARSR